MDINKAIKRMENNFTPRKPDFKGDGISIWKSKDKNGKEYMRVCVLGGKSIACFSTEENGT